ncbi:MAG TPA: OB-fold domain-containing protein [Candidatus Dormibacteraeota bacterium]
MTAGAATAAARPVAEGLFVWPSPPGEARLIASRCPECQDVAFPAVAHCRMPACSLVETQRTEISGSGTVISYTVQRYQPPGPFGRQVPYRPIPIALVEFRAGIAVLGVVQGWDGQPVAAGRRARLVLAPLYPDADGTQVVGWGYELQ